ncbi:polysaccharide deacetylase family protein [Pseudorhodobacter aquimaris]|uniref:polysaccharide deacetylase family protein n=1 Tax=Pseudorhodobacter aquimaris TaxID=687412 RepID=UPI000AD40461|nr:polysaccharide deacetylase family protein [Pseudorhodobacter aquimaris]
MPELILTFHGIGTPADSIGDEEKNYWATADVFQKIIAEAAEFTARTGFGVLVTFDDGNKSDIAIGAPTLLQYGVPGFFFPCSGRVSDPAYLSQSDIRSLSESGFGIGSHGIDHVKWPSLTPQQLDYELSQSRLEIGEACGVEIVDAALPFGFYDSKVLRALGSKGYKTIYSSDPGLSRASDRFRRRYSYRSDRGIDIPSLIRKFEAPFFRGKSRVKHVLKSWR